MNVSASMYLPVNPLPQVRALVLDARSRLENASEYANPVRPMMMPVQPVDFRPALVEARAGIELIEQSLNLPGARLSDGIRDALASAMHDARTGIQWITSPTTIALDPVEVAGRFSASAMWLRVADQLLQTEIGQPQLMHAQA